MGGEGVGVGVGSPVSDVGAGIEVWAGVGCRT